MRRIHCVLTCWLLSMVASCSRSEVAIHPTPKTDTQRANDAESATADRAAENSTEPQDDAGGHSAASNHPRPETHEPAHADQHQRQPEHAVQEHAPPAHGGQHHAQPGNGDQDDAPATDHGPSSHAQHAPHQTGHSPATAEGNRVTIVPVPAGGRPIAAKTGPDGMVHLLFDSVDGPQLAISKDDGLTFGDPIAVVDRESRKPGLEFSAWDMAVGKSGRVHVAVGTNAWKLKLPQEEWGFYYAAFDTGGKAFTPLRNINRKPSEGYSLAADERGNVTACWLSGKLYANVSHDNGDTFGPNVEIDPAYDPCNCCTTSSLYSADGKLAVLYREETNDERDMYLVLWDQDRNQVSRSRISGTLWKVDACPMSYYAISRGQGGFVSIWPTEGQIYFARLDSQGRALPPAEIKTPGRSGMRTGMLALSAPDGRTLIAWKKDDHLGWQLYDAQGRPSGSPGSAGSTGNGVAGVVDTDGEFILYR
jgi:hypothetical protein